MFTFSNPREAKEFLEKQIVSEAERAGIPLSEKEALHPYPEGLVIVTKLGARRGADGSWIQDHSPECLTGGLHDNLRNLDLEAMDIVNLRGTGMAAPGPEFDPRPSLEVLAKLQAEGLIRHIGVSNVSAQQVEWAEEIVDVVCVQNNYNLANRGDDGLIDELEAAGVPYVPYFPLGGFTPLQSEDLSQVARVLGATPMQVALAWLLQRSPNMVLIPGTSQVSHLEENLAAAGLDIPAEMLAKLDGIAGEAQVA